MPSFVEFQYVELNPDVKAHKSVLRKLEQNDLKKHLKQPFMNCSQRVIQRVKDMDKDMDKDKDKDIDKDIIRWFEEAWGLYPNRVGKKAAKKHFMASIKKKEDFYLLMKAMANYKKSEKVLKGYVQNGSTWFNDWESWVDYDIPKAETVLEAGRRERAKRGKTWQ